MMEIFVERFLLFISLAALVVGALGVYYLFKRRCLWPAFFLMCAYVTLLIILGTAIAANDTSEVTAKATISFTNDALANLNQFSIIYISIFTYSLMALVTTMLANVKFAALQAVIFIFFLPYLSLFYRSYLVFAAFITLGLALACTLLSILSALATITRLTKRGGKRLCIGSDAYSHVLYYLALLYIIAAGTYCGRLALFVDCLAIAFIAATLASVGIVYETNAFENTSILSLVNGVRRCFAPRSSRA